MQIAVTSQNFRTVTGHAGKGRRFLIYEVDGTSTTEVNRLDLPKEMSFHEFGGIAHPLDGTAVLVTHSHQTKNVINNSRTENHSRFETM